MKKLIFIAGLLTAVLLLNIACNSAASAEVAELEHEEDGHMDEDDSHAHSHVAPPREFAGLANPFADDEAAVAAGKVTYDALCATCHGPDGNGDGPAAEGLDPQPAALSDGMMMRQVSEGYLFWRVSKGGMMEPFNSAMPAWETGLSETERWQVIAYIRSLGSGDGHMDDNHMDDDGHMEDDHSN